ncbi:metal ABC transporter substrate-binding protein [Sulfurimonas sp.]|jgi:zinc transport system substrate-binding protein|uniref:metal ABC transporter substrate-binding protein n=1 Tax=Sulfurimonas sp. TaxID=2022749 RepID=UPI0025DE8F92|nr:metal ABC transporter substrate-binding protein [Sulfurimonas sp.]MBT5934901.1 zinc ABC transporter substrate-binding protein [Sulfurimonas sp.]
MKNIKIITSILALLFVTLILFVFTNEVETKTKKISIAISTYSLYDITKFIGGDSLEITSIIPFGVDPHSFELTPRLMAKIEDSTLVLYSGAGLEPWIEGFNFKNRAIDMSKYVNLRNVSKEEHNHEEHDHEEHGHDCLKTGIDPHYWLDFENMKLAATKITEELIVLLPENVTLYKNRKNKYIKMLDDLDASYITALRGCKRDTIILSHNSIGYLAQKYNFHTESLSGLSPEDEPTADDVKRVFEEILNDKQESIFFEHFVSNKLILSMAKDTNVSVDMLHSLGNITKDELLSGASYESIMQENLQKISKALSCQ